MSLFSEPELKDSKNNEAISGRHINEIFTSPREDLVNKARERYFMHYRFIQDYDISDAINNLSSSDSNFYLNLLPALRNKQTNGETTQLKTKSKLGFFDRFFSVCKDDGNHAKT